MEQTTLSARHQLQCDHATTVPHARAPRGRCAPSGTGRTGVVYAFRYGDGDHVKIGVTIQVCGARFLCRWARSAIKLRSDSCP